MRIAAIHIHTTQPEVLGQFYQNVLGLEPTYDFQNATVFTLGDLILVIMHHNRVFGKSRYPERMFFDLQVEDVRAEFNRVLALGATVIQEPYSYSYGPMNMNFATLADPDGNYFQLRAEAAPLQDKYNAPG